jgi:cell wall assembly regulator SMI1
VKKLEKIIKLLDSKKPGVSKKDLEDTEKKIGAAFPKEYREFVQKANNAEVGEWILHPIKDSKNIKKTWDDIVRKNIENRWETMNSCYIEFADDGTGDKLCFKISENRMCSEIYFWDHESGEVKKISDNFLDMINSFLGPV